MIRKRILSVVLTALVFLQLMPINIVAQSVKSNVKIDSEDEDTFLNGLTFNRLPNKEFVDMIANRKGISFFSALDYIEDKLGRKICIEDLDSGLRNNLFTFEHIWNQHRFVALGEISKTMDIASSDGKFVKRICVSIPIELQAQYHSTEITDSNGTHKVITDIWNTGTYSISNVIDDSVDIIPLDKNLSKLSAKIITVKQYTPSSIQVRGTVGISSYNAEYLNSVGTISFTEKLSNTDAPGFKTLWDILRNLFSRIF